MSVFGSLGRALGFSSPSTPDMSEAIAELDNLPEYKIENSFLLDPLNYKLGPTALEGVQVDPRYKAAQIKALEELSRIGEVGGLTDADRAALQTISEEESMRERGQREAITQNAQQRGLGGSGMELATQLMASQGASQRAAQEGRDVAQMAQARALEALIQSGNLGGNMRAQEYGEQANLARARDIISEFNLKNSLALAEREANARQAIADQNIGGKRDVGYRKSDIKSGSAVRAADAQNEQDRRLSKSVGGIFKAGGAVAGSIFGGPVGGMVGEKIGGMNPFSQAAER